MDPATIADEVSRELVAGQLGEVRDRFGCAMSLLVSRRRLEKGWRSAAQINGQPTAWRHLRTVPHRSKQVVDTLVDCTDGAFVLRIAINRRGRVVRLLLLQKTRAIPEERGGG